jgi:hypothetical protein
MLIPSEPQEMKFFSPELTARIHPKICSSAYKSTPFESAGLARMPKSQPWVSTIILLSQYKETAVFTTSLQSKLPVKV